VGYGWSRGPLDDDRDARLVADEAAVVELGPHFDQLEPVVLLVAQDGSDLLVDLVVEGDVVAEDDTGTGDDDRRGRARRRGCRRGPGDVSAERSAVQFSGR